MSDTYDRQEGELNVGDVRTATDQLIEAEPAPKRKASVIIDEIGKGADYLKKLAKERQELFETNSFNYEWRKSTSSSRNSFMVNIKDVVLGEYDRVIRETNEKLQALGRELASADYAP